MKTYPTRDPSDVSGAKSLDICTDGSLYGSQYVFSCAVGRVSVSPPAGLAPVRQNPLVLVAIHAEIINLRHNGMFMHKCNSDWSIVEFSRDFLIFANIHGNTVSAHAGNQLLYSSIIFTVVAVFVLFLIHCKLIDYFFHNRSFLFFGS